MKISSKIESDSEHVVDSMNFREPRHKKRVEMCSAIIALMVVSRYIPVFSESGYSSYLLFIVVVLLFLTTPIHESIHFIFQWLFSCKKPYMGFKFPYPYSALAKGARITRGQAIICALAPFFFVTSILFLLSLLFGQPIKMIIQAWAFIEIATCFGDLYLVIWLLQHSSHTRLGNANLTNTLFKGD